MFPSVDGVEECEYSSDSDDDSKECVLSMHSVDDSEWDDGSEDRG